MKVAILGTGPVGIALGKGFAAQGHTVIFGSRDPQAEHAAKAVAAVAGSRAASHAQAAAEGEIAVLATPWSGTANALQLAGADKLAGKVVIDATNPLDFSGGKPQLTLGFTDSAGETVQRILPQARVVKAFNTIGNAHFVQPKFADGQPDMFIAGNDAAAKRQVAGIVRAFGWREPVDAGGIEKSRLLESLAMLWIDYGASRNHWTHGFSLLGRQA